MSEQNNMDQEIELEFFEPTLGLIISNLEFLEDELQQEGKNLKELTNLIDAFNELEDIDLWDGLVAELEAVAKKIEKIIFDIVDVNRVKLLSYLYLGLSLAVNLKEEKELMQFAVKLEDKLIAGEFENTEENLIAEYKVFISEMINNLLLTVQAGLEKEINNSEEFKKVLNILVKEKDLTDLKEGNDVLLSLYAVENEFSLKDQTLKHFKTLTEVEGLITLINFWEQDNLDDEEEA